MIKLYYIENINRLDTLRFTNINQQTNYYDTRSIVEIDAIYPPLYRNTIQVSIDDLSPTTKVNYLSLLYNDKRYYYFIDGINYINEGVYEIIITLDTIQTFLFDINIKEGILERETIERWKGTTPTNATINRDYIRENLSNSDTYDIKVYEKDLSLACMVYKLRIPTKATTTFGGGYVHIENMTQAKNTILNGLQYIILPILNENILSPQLLSDNTKIEFQHLDNNGNYVPFNTTGTTATIMSTLGEYKMLQTNIEEYPYCVEGICVKNEWCSNIYSVLIQANPTRIVIRYNAKSIYGLTDSISQYNIVALTQDDSLLKDKHIPLFYGLNCNINTTIKTLTNETNNNFEVSTNPYNLFSTRYIPQLLDENYIKMYYGEYLGFTSFPLHHLTRPTVYCNSLFDILTTTRAYNITDNINNNDKYFTTITNTSKQILPLYYDALKNYQVTNAGTLTIGLANSFQKQLFGTAGSTVSALEHYRGNREVAMALSSKSKAYSQAMQNRALYGLEASLIGSSIHLASSTAGMIMDIETAKKNAEYTPDTTKTGNSYSMDLSINSTERLYKVEYIEDIEQVGKRLEQNGYLINRQIINTTLTSEDFNKRYYFNVIKFKNIKVDINYINTTDIIDDIRDRLMNGLRLWNYGINYNSFKYDNTEHIFIE